MEAKQNSVNLKDIFESYNLPDIYHTKLVDQGFGSIELLSQCSDKDVEQLSNELSLNLVDKLKLKQALNSINIPRESVKYAVINEEEQSAIAQIHQSIKTVENIIIQKNMNSNALQNKLNSDKQEIYKLFDTIQKTVNQRKADIINRLQINFANEQSQTEQLLQYLTDAKNTKIKCQNLILSQHNFTDIQSRNQSIIHLKEQCLSSLSEILQSVSSTQSNLQIRKDSNIINKAIDTLFTFANAKNTYFGNDEKEQKTETFAESHGQNKENMNVSNIPQTVIFTKQSHFPGITKPKAYVKPTQSDQESEENYSQITFQPLIELKEQSTESGHESEELIQSFNISKLYYFGKDITGQQTWKLRAAETQLEFYGSNSVKKARLICREFQTSKLRLNHYIPSNSQLNCKSEKLLVWTAYDVTIEENVQNHAYSTFCAKFTDAKTASDFRICFEKCQELLQ